MEDVKVITPSDLGEGINWNATNSAYEAVSQVYFTERTAYVELLINGKKLLFRELANSNQIMVVTGVFDNGAWYGDAPDGETALNPFTGQPVSKPQPISGNLFVSRTELENYAKIGENGTWSNAVPLSSDLNQPQRVAKYDSSTNNRPNGSTYGVAVSFTSSENYKKAVGNWLPTLAFDTGQRLYYTQSINGANSSWVAIPTADFACHTTSFSSTTPNVGTTAVINVPAGLSVHRHNMIDVKARVDLPNMSVMFQGRLEAVIDNKSIITGIRFTNDKELKLPNKRPITIFLTYKN